MNDTLFYVLGLGLASLAVITTFVGLRVPNFPGSNATMVAIVAIFVALVGGATTFAVLNAQDEQEARASELTRANEQIEEKEQPPGQQPSGEEGGQAGATGGQEGGAQAKPEAAAKGAGGTLKLAADPTAIAFDKTSLSSKPGQVTIDFTNPSALEHNVAIEEDGKQLAISDTIAEGETSVSVDLAPGSYTFLCTIPGHAEAGMEGTLTVK